MPAFNKDARRGCATSLISRGGGAKSGSPRLAVHRAVYATLAIVALVCSLLHSERMVYRLSDDVHNDALNGELFRRLTQEWPPDSSASPRVRDDGVKVYAPSKHNSTVAACLLVKNETAYLDEWLDYHIALGFGPVYIYDNSDDFELEKWNRIGDKVRVRHFSIEGAQQKAAYNQCVKEDAKNDTFVAFLDIDEYLVLRKHDNVVDFMESHCDENCGELSINWKVFGTSNETKYRPVPVTQRNVHADSTWSTVKVIGRVSHLADDLDWQHSVKLREGKWIDTSGRVIRNKGWKRMTNKFKPDDIAVLHHYKFKSDEEWQYKTCVRGRPLGERGDFRKCNNRREMRGYNGATFDDSAWKQLKKMVPKYASYDIGPS